MDSERRGHVDKLYHAARGLPEEYRSEFLDSACRNDAALRREVETLLAAADETDSFLETPAIRLLASEDSTVLLEGRHFGAYRIEALIGMGGMGRVYRAHDTRLRRDVAIRFFQGSCATIRIGCSGSNAKRTFSRRSITRTSPRLSD